MSSTKSSKHKIEQPVVFFPGTLCDERIFADCWARLDIPMRAFAPLQWAEDLAQMKMLSEDRLDYFEQPVHLVGFSLGGYIAALTAIENPQRVASLTVIANTCNVLPEAELQARKLTLKLIKNKQYGGMTSKLISKLFHTDNAQNSEYQNTIKQMEQDLGSAVLAVQYQATQARKNLLPALAKAKFPINFITGEQDHLFSPDTLNSMKKSVPNSCTQIIAGAGHMLSIEQPALLAQFLADKIG